MGTEKTNVIRNTHSKIPYGYRICSGKAVVFKEEVDRLKLFYLTYLNGCSLASSARTAGISLSSSSLPFLLRRKEYVGTEYYPAIITPSYQKALVEEYERRKKQHPNAGRRKPEKKVHVYTEFEYTKISREKTEDPFLRMDEDYAGIKPR